MRVFIIDLQLSGLFNGGTCPSEEIRTYSKTRKLARVTKNNFFEKAICSWGQPLNHTRGWINELKSPMLHVRPKFPEDSTRTLLTHLLVAIARTHNCLLLTEDSKIRKYVYVKVD